MEESASNVEEVATNFWAILDSGWGWYWMITKSYAIPGGLIIMSAIALYIMGASLRLNYHYYIKHGQFVFFTGEGTREYKKKITEVSQEHKISLDDDLLPWIQALIGIGLQAIIVLLFAFIWPLTLITVMPLAVVRLIAFRKRKKTLFVQKLEGTANDN